MSHNKIDLVLSLALTLTFGGFVAFAQNAPAQPGGAPDVLRKRAQEFYTFLQLRQFPKAEAYVTKETRERLRDQANNPFMAFKVLSAQINPDGKTGVAETDITVMAAFMGGTTQVTRSTQWQLEDGEWRIVVPLPPTNTLEGMMGMGSTEPKKAEELKFAGHGFNLGVIKQTESKTARFPFKNETDHVVTISRIQTGCDCLKDLTTKKAFKPGESGEVVVEFNSSDYEFQYEQTIVVQTSPTDAKSYLKVSAEVVPRAIAFPQSAESQPQPRPQ